MKITNIPILVAVLLVVDSLHFVFANALHPLISPSISALYVMLAATLEVGIYGLYTRQIKLIHLKDNLPFFLAIGFLVAASTNLNYEAIAFIDPGTATLLAQTGVLWRLALGIFWLKDILSGRQILGAAITLAGVFTITYQGGNFMRLGSLLVVVSAFMYALHAAITKRSGDGIDFLNFFFFRVLMSTLFLSVFSVSRHALDFPPRPAWLLLIVAATVDIVISRVLYYLALRQLTLSIHTLLLTLSPVLTVIWALLFFKHIPSNQQLLGGAAVILGVAIINLARKIPPKPAAA